MSMTKTHNNSLLTLIAALALLSLCPAAAPAQRNKAKAKAAVASKPKEDLSRWRESPVCRVLIADSVVVDADDIFKHIPLPAYLGHIARDKDSGALYHENDFGDQRFFALPDSSGQGRLYRSTLLAGRWGGAETVAVGGDCYDYQRPFPMPDGQTLLFAARHQDDNEGQCLSLYTTTYDAEHDAYLTPQRLPYPFNSDADDLYYIEDEADTLSWLVTTRAQPHGKACVYTIRARQPWEQYDPDTTDVRRLKSLATIERIADTWTTAKARRAVLATVQTLASQEAARPAAPTMRFVVSDNRVITSPDEFLRPASRELYARYREAETAATKAERQLEEYRRLFHTTPEASRNPLRTAITRLEEQRQTAAATAASLAKQIRRAELGQ